MTTIDNGFVRNEKGEIINHRIWFKNIFNPLLRKIGLVIVTKLDNKKEKIVGYGIRRYPF